MDFALTEEQAAIFDTAREVGRERITPHARDWERQGTIPRELWPDLAALGFGGLYVSEEAGGAGLSRLDATLVFEALSMACAVGRGVPIDPQHVRGDDRPALARTPLRARDPARCVVAMETVLSYCLTEPGSGSDAAALQDPCRRGPTRAGGSPAAKAFISGGGYSDAYIVMCAHRAGTAPKGVSAYRMSRTAPTGLSFGALEDKMGWRSQPTRQVQLDGCPGHGGESVGRGGARLRLCDGRGSTAAGSTSPPVRSVRRRPRFDATLRLHEPSVKPSGSRLTDFQALQFRLAETEIEQQAARTFLRHAAWMPSTPAQPDATKRCAMAKAFVTEAGLQAAVDRCLQLHGGYGYLADYGDREDTCATCSVHQILEGTNEIMRLIVSRQMLAAA